MNKQKGFTIIELIVVIAIIAVLASIVLVSVTQYIGKGKDAAIKSNMQTIATNAAIWLDNNGNKFTNGTATFTGDALYTTPANAIIGAGGAITPHFNATSGFCVYATLNDASTWCVDSTGYKGATTTNCTAVGSTNYSCQ